MAGSPATPRTRGSICGLALVLLGAWGALIPFVGPYFRFGFTPDRAWAYTEGRLVLSAVPGAVALLAGLVVMLTRSRGIGTAAAIVAALAGGWFIAGSDVVAALPGVFRPGSVSQGLPIATGTRLIMLTTLSFWAATGALIVFFAALAVGRFSLLAAKDLPDDATFAGTQDAGYDTGYATGAYPSVQLQYPAEQRYQAEHRGYQPGRDQLTTTEEYRSGPDYQRAVPDYQHARGGSAAAEPVTQQYHPPPDAATRHDFARPGDAGQLQGEGSPAQYPGEQQPPFPPAPEPFTSTDPTRRANPGEQPPAPYSS
jgi:hypothetical protein